MKSGSVSRICSVSPPCLQDETSPERLKSELKSGKLCNGFPESRVSKPKHHVRQDNSRPGLKAQTTSMLQPSKTDGESLESFRKRKSSFSMMKT